MSRNDNMHMKAYFDKYLYEHINDLLTLRLTFLKISLIDSPVF